MSAGRIEFLDTTGGTPCPEIRLRHELLTFRLRNRRAEIPSCFSRIETARIRNGRAQTGTGVSGRLGEPATRARDYLQEEIRVLKGSWNAASGLAECFPITIVMQHAIAMIRVSGQYGMHTPAPKPAQRKALSILTTFHNDETTNLRDERSRKRVEDRSRPHSAPQPQSSGCA
jgi:hypothetical protein